MSGNSVSNRDRRGAKKLEAKEASVEIRTFCERGGRRSYLEKPVIKSSKAGHVTFFSELPSRVSSKPVGKRSNSLAPMKSSRARICLLTAPCVTPSSSAARERFKCRLAAWKALMALSGGRRLSISSMYQLRRENSILAGRLVEDQATNFRHSPNEKFANAQKCIVWREFVGASR